MWAGEARWVGRPAGRRRQSTDLLHRQACTHSHSLKLLKRTNKKLSGYTTGHTHLRVSHNDLGACVSQHGLQRAQEAGTLALHQGRVGAAGQHGLGL